MKVLVRTISIETIDFCNRKCDWCPNKDRVQKKSNTINDELFSKILQDIKDIDYQGEIHPYFRNEPLCDPKIHERIKEIRKVLPDNRIRLNTNGDFLNTVEDVQKLFDAGVSSIHIMNYDIKNIDGSFSDSLFGSKVTHWFGETLFNIFDNRGGSLDLDCKDKRELCPFIGYKVMILYNGKVVTCCNDFFETNVFGDLNTQPLYEILISPKYERFRQLHAVGKGKTLPLCKECNRI